MWKALRRPVARAAVESGLLAVYVAVVWTAVSRVPVELLLVLPVGVWLVREVGAFVMHVGRPGRQVSGT